MARVYTPPTFNLVCDLWIDGGTAASTTPDYANLPCALYFRQGYPPGSMYYSNPSGAATGFALRLPIDSPGFPSKSFSSWSPQMFFAVMDQGRLDPSYYVKDFADIAHRGFPNEYIWVLVQQVHDDGSEFKGWWTA